MKKAVQILRFFLFAFLVSTNSCDLINEEDKETCGDWAQPGYWDMKAKFEEWSGVHFAHFTLTVPFTDVCIYKNADITVRVKEKPGAVVVDVRAFAVMQTSTPPAMVMTHANQKWQSELSLNLRQGFSVNPGNFDIKVHIWFYTDTSSEQEAQKFYDDYISGIDIYSSLYRPKD